MDRAPGAVRADPGPDWASFDRADVEGLVEDARRWARVGRHAIEEPERFLGEIVGGLWGARADAAGGRFGLAPWIVEGWGAMALRRLRCHRTLLDIEVRTRAEWITCRLEVTFGPPIPLELSLRNVTPVARVTVDEIPLEGNRVIFTAAGEHEVVFYLGAWGTAPPPALSPA